MRGNVARTVVWVVAVSVGLLAQSASAQAPCPGTGAYCPNGGSLGPCAGWVDTNGNGKYDTGEPLITFTYIPGTPPANSLLYICNPWSASCDPGNVKNLITFNSTNANGCFDHAYRSNGLVTQGIGVTSFVGTAPVLFSYTDSGGGSGIGTLVPPGGPYSGMLLGPPLSLLVGFQGVDATGKGGAFNHITIPWALSSALGMGGACKLGNPDPQIFLPINGNQITFGAPFDAHFCNSATFSLAQWTPPTVIRTLGEWGMALLMISLATLGWMALRQRQVFA